MNVPPEIVLQIVSHYNKRVVHSPVYRHENVLMWCDKCNAKHYERIKVECGAKMQMIAGDLASAKALREVSTTFARAYGIAYMIENIGADFRRTEYVRVIRANSYFARSYLIDLHARHQVEMLTRRLDKDYNVENAIIQEIILPVVTADNLLIYDTDQIRALYDVEVENTNIRLGAFYKRLYDCDSGRNGKITIGKCGGISTRMLGRRASEFMSRLSTIGLCQNNLSRADIPYEEQGEREIGFGKTFSRSTIAAMYPYPESMQPSGRVNLAPANFTRTDEDQFRYSWDIETYSGDRQISYSDLSWQNFPQILLVSHRPARPDPAPQQLAPPANQRLAPASAPRSKKYPKIRSKRLNKQSGRRR